MTERLAYRPEEAAEAIGVGRDLVYHLIRTGKLRAVKLGHRTTVIPAIELDHFLGVESQRTAAITGDDVIEALREHFSNESRPRRLRDVAGRNPLSDG